MCLGQLYPILYRHVWETVETSKQKSVTIYTKSKRKYQKEVKKLWEFTEKKKERHCGEKCKIKRCFFSFFPSMKRLKARYFFLYVCVLKDKNLGNINTDTLIMYLHSNYVFTVCIHTFFFFFAISNTWNMKKNKNQRMRFFTELPLYASVFFFKKIFFAPIEWFLNYLYAIIGEDSWHPNKLCLPCFNQTCNAQNQTQCF